MIRSLLSAGLAFGLIVPSVNAQGDNWYAKAVKSVEATFDPPQAKPGQVVTLKLTITLNPGYHTYPTKQPDKPAAAFTNRITFPGAAGVIFVGETKDPANPDTKPEPDLGIKELRTYHGKVVYERPAIVSPKAAAGEVTVTLKAVRLTVCEKDNCFPPKTLTPAAKLTVLPGPAVPVPPEYREAVENALAGK